MLKINLKNKKLNQRKTQKEITFLLQQTFSFFFKKKKLSNTRFQSYLRYWNQKLLFKSPFTKTRTICFLTGRSRSVYRTFHLSRLKLREFAAVGYFCGLSKASW